MLERNESIYKLEDNIVIRKNDDIKQYWLLIQIVGTITALIQRHIGF